MRSFYLPGGGYAVGALLVLPAELRDHIERVLRLQPGTEIRLFDGSGLVAVGTLSADGEVAVRDLTREAAPRCRLCLIQGVPKGDKLELILQKGTELGVNDFVIAQMERSVAKLKNERRGKRRERWHKIIREAARQAQQYHLPRLTIEDSLAQALTAGGAEEKFLLWEESSVALKTVLPKTPPQSISVVVGPEGGLSRGEAEAAMAQGFKPVSLGPRILRTETAGLAIMSILQYLYGDLAGGRKQ